jgi:hypothetical protein
MNSEVQFWMTSVDANEFLEYLKTGPYTVSGNETSIIVGKEEGLIHYEKCLLYNKDLCAGRIAIKTEDDTTIKHYRKISRWIKTAYNNNVYGHSDILNSAIDVVVKYPSFYVGKNAEIDAIDNRIVLRQFKNGKVVFTVDKKMV